MVDQNFVNKAPFLNKLIKYFTTVKKVKIKGKNKNIVEIHTYTHTLVIDRRETWQDKPKIIMKTCYNVLTEAFGPFFF